MKKNKHEKNKIRKHTHLNNKILQKSNNYTKCLTKKKGKKEKKKEKIIKKKTTRKKKGKILITKSL